MPTWSIAPATRRLAPGDGLVIDGGYVGDNLLTVASNDVNGDGLVDMLINANGNNLGGSVGTIKSGTTYVLYGSEDLGGMTRIAAHDGENLIGSNAGDLICVGEFSDVAMFGAGGNDVFQISHTQFAHIDGGEGNGDTIRLNGSGLHLDFSALEPAAVMSIERIDLGFGGDTANELTVRLEDVLNVSGNQQMTVTGDANDTVRVLGGFAQTAGETVVDRGVTYDVYHAGTGDDIATLLIQQGVHIV